MVHEYAYFLMNTFGKGSIPRHSFNMGNVNERPIRKQDG